MTNKSMIKLIVGSIIGFVSMVFLLLSIVRIPANTVGVKVSAFGGVQNQTLQTGMHMKIPFIDRVYKLPTSVQTKTMSEITTQTSDGQWLNTNIDVKYRINKQSAMNVFSDYTTLSNVDENAISPAVQRAIESVTGKYDIFEILGSKRTDVYEEIDDALIEMFKQYNLEFVSFTITDQDAGDEIEQAIKDESVKQKQVDSARQDQEKTKIEAETKKIQAQADADAAVIKAKGTADANKSMSDSITDNLIRYEEAQARKKHGWVTVTTNGQAIVDSNGQ